MPRILMSTNRCNMQPGACGSSVTNPFDNSEICKIRPADDAQVNEAIDAAYAAFHRPDWRRLTGRERGKPLYQLAQLLRRDLESFAILESIDTGIPIRETRVEVATSAVHLEYFAGLTGSIEGSCQDFGARFNSTRREPFGVVGKIVPWNIPLKLMARDLRLLWLAARR
jgi:acyl-CoA reductase-like NAD-dependent aldehyde dehydrogenase